MLDRHLVEDIARRLDSAPGLIEKDWYLVRAIGVLAGMDHGGAIPAFSGGTALSKGWELIQRFSEDIDFKVAMPVAASKNRARTERGAFRERVLAALKDAGFPLVAEPRKGSESKFFSADLSYPSMFDTALGLRPFLRVEMTLSPPSLPPIARPIRSLIATVQGQPAEVAAFPCVDPAETAADKLSALVWRVLARKRGGEDDDPSIIRHLHDLAALKATVEASRAFRGLAAKAMAGDVGRGGITETDPNARLAAVLDRLGTDRLWAEEYEDYVRQVSYADPAERIGFTTALAALQALAASVTPA